MEKIGYEVEDLEEISCPYKDLEYPFLVSNEELFWWLVGYGYRLGENDTINYNSYEEKLNG